MRANAVANSGARLLAVAGALAVCAATSGCIYAPFDLGLDAIGKVVEHTIVDGPDDNKILLVRIDGEITGAPDAAGLLGIEPSTTADVRRQLDLARRDDSIKAVIVRINSPGGGVTASDVVYEELRRFRADTGRPVVALFMDVAASGGYYVAQAADRIIAVPTCITGSIGVLSMYPNVSALGDKIGVSVNTITSVPKKDIGNPFRPMAPAERALLQDLVDAMHERFVDVIATGRGARADGGEAPMTRARVREVADGRVYHAEEAKALGLIDEIGYFEDAHRLAESLASLDDSRVVTYERTRIGGTAPTVYSEGAEASAPALVSLGGGSGGGALEAMLGRIAGALPAPRKAVLQYLWAPGAP